MSAAHGNASDDDSDAFPILPVILYEARQRLGLTQWQVAERLGGSYKSVAGWELGRHVPVPRFLGPIAEVLELDLDELRLAYQIARENRGPQIAPSRWGKPQWRLRPVPGPGERYDRLVVVRTFTPDRGLPRNRRVACLCDCGTETVVREDYLYKSGTRSCGCVKRRKAADRMRAAATTHGKSESPLYAIWLGMRDRCERPKSKGYADYGGRGITVCDDWRAFENFHQWAKHSGYADGLWLARLDMNGHYGPGNCAWQTPTEACRRRRNARLLDAFGETKTLQAWVEDPRCSVPRGTLSARIHKLGWDAEKAISEPASTTPRRRSPP